MNDLDINSKDPGEFTIAADVRFACPDYTNDHIWELKLEGGEPPALSIQTTYGLRTLIFRIFPRFIEGDTSITDPNQFSKKPSVIKCYPNYLLVMYEPFTGIDVKGEYWVPSSNVIAGKIQLTNTRLTQRKINVQLAAQLSPISDGQRMALQTQDATKVLLGNSDGIFPMVFISGIPDSSPGPYPALSVEVNLPPGGIRQVNWYESAMGSPEASLEQIQQTYSKDWYAEISRLDVVNEGLLEISTGDPEWDAAIRFSQKSALGLFMGPSEHLPNPSFVLSRQPDKGYSSLGDGTDYRHSWDGQSLLEADYLSAYLLPEYPELVEGYLKNFLAVQESNGFVDFKPGIAGQRSNLLATPILTNLAWKIYKFTEDQNFLSEVFPALFSFIKHWFSDQQDRDGDGLPEWERPVQSGFEDHPLYSQWHPWSLGGDISKVESPSLCAMLYNEIYLLKEIAHILGQDKRVKPLLAKASKLKEAIEISWDEKEFIYRNWDRESHCSPKGEDLGSLMGTGEIQLNHEFEQPIRLTITIELLRDLRRNLNIFIHGTGTTNAHLIERIDSDQIRWHIDRGRGIVNSERIYTALECVIVEGAEKLDKTTIKVMEISGKDHTLLLPLWAGIPDEGRAFNLVTKTIKNPQIFWKPCGIPACVQDGISDEHPCWYIHPLWNSLIGEGMLTYGYRNESAELVMKLMETIIDNLKTHKTFTEYYHATTGQGIGEKGAPGGLVPIGLFLETLGVRIMSATKVMVFGYNPFPWPVKIRYRGLTVTREKENSRILFPGGQSAIVRNQEPRLVTLKYEDDYSQLHHSQVKDSLN